MSYRVPAEGHRVPHGQEPPAKSEATGAVGSDSLAAESVREGGGFASNPDSHSENLSADTRSTRGAETLESAPDAPTREARNDNVSNTAASYDEARKNTARSDAGTAPGYILSQSATASGPHGKNIQEGFDDAGTKDGLKAAMEAEPGSKMDPSRAAELQFQLTNEGKRGAEVVD